MYNNILLSRYFPIRSKMHDMDPFAKMLCVVIYVVVLLLTNIYKGFSVIIILSIVNLIMILRSNVPFGLYMKTISSASPVILLVIIGTLLVRVDYLLILSIIVKMVLIILYTSIVTFTSTPTEITYGFQKLLLPLELVGVPTSKVALNLTLLIRYIPITIEQSDRIKKTQASRGVDYDNSSLFGKIKAFFGMIEPIIRLSNMRSKELIRSMQIRMYTIYNKRTSYRTKFWGFKDTFIVLLHATILIIFVTKEVLNHGSLLDDFLIRWH